MAVAAEPVESLLTTGSASRLLEISCDTIRGYVRAGKLPATRTESGMLLFRRSDLEVFAEARKRAKGRAA